MFPKKTLQDVDIAGQTVLLRADYNVPLDYDPETNATFMTSDFRIRANLPTLRYLLDHDAAKIIIIAHLGRPKGQPDEKLSLRIVAEKLAELLPGAPVNFVDQITGPEVETAASELPEGGILLLENLRFSPGEEQNSKVLAQEIVDSTHATLFVQDGFAVAHRAHASTEAIAQLLPSCAGLLLEREVIALKQTIEDPAKPFIVMIGGAKVSDKQPLIDRFLPIADRILVGGKIAADGYQSDHPKIYVAEDFDENNAGEKLDIGPIATMKFIETLQSAHTVLWNGVLGKVEDAAYATSSAIVAKFLGENPTITSVICGGDTAGFVENLLIAHPELKFSLISTGGGAALELLSGKTMPGISALEDR